ncbi:hypothetical protein MHYP_G00001170 [Metynnis hypsauchen]
MRKSSWHDGRLSFDGWPFGVGDYSAHASFTNMCSGQRKRRPRWQLREPAGRQGPSRDEARQGGWRESPEPRLLPALAAAIGAPSTPHYD